MSGPKEFTGGVVTKDSLISINLNFVNGGSQTRVYVDTITESIDKLVIVTNALSKIKLDDEDSMRFYVNELVTLFSSTKIDFVQNIGLYQLYHNINLLIGYINQCIKSKDAYFDILILDCYRMIEEFETDTNKQIYKPKNELTIIFDVKPYDKKEVIMVANELQSLLTKYVSSIESRKIDIQKLYKSLVNAIENSINSE